MSFGLAIDPGKRRAGVTLFSLDSKRIVAAGLVSCDSKEEGPTAARMLAEVTLAWATGRASARIGRIGIDAWGFDLHHINLHHIKQFVAEWPQTYGGRASQGDTNDLFPLAALDGALAMALPVAVVTHYVANEWKGGIEKPKKTADSYPIESKVRERLSPEELASIEWPKNVKYTYDVTDSIGIALKFLGRFDRIRVYARE